MRMSRDLPTWLAHDREPHPDKHRNRSRAYYRTLHRATPPWFWGSEHEFEMRRIYKEAKTRRLAGEDVHVDHVVPLKHPYVCGLAVPWNLQILPAAANISKSNRWWPDCPWDNHDLFSEPEQLRLFP